MESRVKKIRLYNNLPREVEFVDDSEIEELSDILKINREFYRTTSLSLPQLGINKAGFIYQYNEASVCVFNPKIFISGGEIVKNYETCMSMPEVRVLVPRFLDIDVEYMDISREMVKKSVGNLESIIFQHEISHLQNENLLDSLSLLKKEMAKKKIKKFLAKSKYGIFFE